MHRQVRTKKKFYPDYLIEIITIGLIALEILLILAFVYPSYIGRQMDFTRQFQPRPEWYFLWIFEIIKYFPSKFSFIGAIVFPLIYIALFISIPFISKYGRIKTNIIGVFLFLIFAIFTLISL